MTAERETIRTAVVSKDIFGSITESGKYSSDTVPQLIAWLRGILDDIPPECHDMTFVRIGSVGGYEGEHHAEIEVYWDRWETDEEMTVRLANLRDREVAKKRERHDEELRQLAILLRKHGIPKVES